MGEGATGRVIGVDSAALEEGARGVGDQTSSVNATPAWSSLAAGVYEQEFCLIPYGQRPFDSNAQNSFKRRLCPEVSVWKAASEFVEPMLLTDELRCAESTLRPVPTEQNHSRPHVFQFCTWP